MVVLLLIIMCMFPNPPLLKEGEEKEKQEENMYNDLILTHVQENGDVRLRNKTLR